MSRNSDIEDMATVNISTPSDIASLIIGTVTVMKVSFGRTSMKTMVVL